MTQYKSTGDSSLNGQMYCTYWEAIRRLHKQGKTDKLSAFVLSMVFGRDEKQVLKDLIEGVP